MQKSNNVLDDIYILKRFSIISTNYYCIWKVMSAQPSETELLNCLSFGHPHNCLLLTIVYRLLEEYRQL